LLNTRCKEGRRPIRRLANSRASASSVVDVKTNRAATRRRRHKAEAPPMNHEAGERDQYGHVAKAGKVSRPVLIPESFTALLLPPTA
jgi:hypothetical protein